MIYFIVPISIMSGPFYLMIYIIYYLYFDWLFLV